MADILEKITRYKLEEIARAKAATPLRVISELRPQRPARAPVRRRHRGQAQGRAAGADRRGEEGEPVEGADPRRLRSPSPRQGLRGRRRGVPLRAHRWPLVPGRAGVSDASARGDLAAGAAQGLHARHLPGCRGTRLGRRLHPHHPGRGRRRPRRRTGAAAKDWGMDAIAEVHDDAELDRALRSTAASSASTIAI